MYHPFPDRFKNEILPLFPAPVFGLLAGLGSSIQVSIEEIRLRNGNPLLLQGAGQEYAIRPDGSLSKQISDGYRVTGDDIQRVVQIITKNSFYAVVEELRHGYLTVPGGHRVGFAGEAVLDKGRVKTMKNISALNLRLAREVKGSADKVMPYLLRPGRKRLYHAMLISPPRGGKTTLLRDIVRQVSNGIPPLGLPGLNVGVVDERSEIAGCYRGIPQNEVGVRTDVLDGCPKAEGMLMLLRSMGPQVMVTDEIGGAEDVAAMEEIVNAGVTVLTTAHASSLAELERRPVLRPLLARNLFERVIVLGHSQGVGTVEAVIDTCTRASLSRAAGSR